MPGIGRTVTVEAHAVRLGPARHGGLPYSGHPEDPAHPGSTAHPDHTAAAGDPATAVAVPYFQWDNRDGRAMRVWMPRSGPAQ